MTKQVKTIQRKSTTVLRCAAFARGFRDASNGKPFDYTAFENNPNKQWNYERGRQFSFVYLGKLKNGNRLAWQAVDAMNLAIQSHTIR